MQPAIWTGMYAEKPLHEALCILHGHGWTAFEASTEHLVMIETSTSPDECIAQVGQCVHDLNLAMPQAHALLQADVAASDKDKRQQDIARLACHIDIAAKMGVKNVVIHPGGRQKVTTRIERDRNWSLNVTAFRYLGDLAGERGLRIGLENLVRCFGSPYELLDLISEIDHPAIGITFDTSHANVVGLDLPATVCEFAPYLIATHISDNDGSGDQHRTPGNAKIDWLAVMKAFRQVGYDGLFNLEIPGERHANLPLRALQSRLACHVAEWLVAYETNS
ncbi:MAG: sugar phosphate isomerase/epimerase [Anaerolineae bacterium]|nr:sugar phosphate isomerase/epimerase [Anaerolineae bacterium]